MHPQDFHRLRVINFRKQGLPRPLALPCPGALSGALRIDTCLRKLWVYTSDLFPHFDHGRHGEDQGVEVHAGIEAYAFLLRVAAGLESEIAGETDIFGQVKEAWRQRAGIAPAQEAALSPLMQGLFEDTKEVRSRYLDRLGGSSYGSLVRRFLRERSQATGRAEPVLLVGAGKLAVSIAPWLLEHELWITNRNVDKARALAEELRREHREARIRVLESRDEEAQAWKNAAHAVVCIPVAAAGDEKRIEWFRAENAAVTGAAGRSAGAPIKTAHRHCFSVPALAAPGARSVIHLGGFRAECAKWQALEGFFCLEDIFEMQKRQDNVRQLQISRARNACEERAKLRALGGSLHVAHGWEDLAYFIS
ncbi:MAG: hypothetical protein HYW49_05605 [Deltaproteobacteria bacterium]|nr:hypothetical protein [Deltaproteobacteria bacterium]